MTRRRGAPNPIPRWKPAAGLWIALLAAVVACSEQYADAPPGDALTVRDAYVPAPPLDVAALYLEIDNPTDQDDRLVSASSPVAQHTMLHRTEIDGATARMVHAERGFEVPAGASLPLAPGGRHVMLMGLTETLAEGDTVRVDLVFERAGVRAVEARVVSYDAAAERAADAEHAGHAP